MRGDMIGLRSLSGQINWKCGHLILYSISEVIIYSIDNGKRRFILYGA